MSKLQLPTSLTRTFYKTGLQLKKHSPEILVVTGVIGAVASAVMACKATLKVNEVVENAKDNIDKIHEATENGCTAAGEDYTVEDSKKDLTIVYAQTGLAFVKLYGPAIILGAASIAGIVSSNHILRKRNIALAAAYATVDKGFKEYRGRLIDRFGKDLDYELRHNIKAKEIEEIVVNEDGTEQTVKTTINVADPNEYSEYARFFDDGCTGWDKNPEYSLMFLKQQQNWANEKLQAQGHLFLNEVYDMLGIPRTKAGQVVGWVLDETNPDCDNFVDFGISDIHKEKVRDFVNGYERVVLLDFNVTGVIYDLIQ